MKKSVLIALASLAIGATSTATAQEVTYVEDCAQGYLLNQNKDNWFLTVRGGTNILFSDYDIKADLKDRWGANAALFVGKWVTPNFGFRFGASWIMPKGVTPANGLFRKMNAEALPDHPGYYPEKFQGIGPEIDVLINLTNWWCGYKPDRVYNAVLHGGAGAYWTFRRAYKTQDDGSEALRWRAAHETRMFATVGIQNNFRVAKHVDIFVDVQYEIINFSNYNQDLQVAAGLNFNFGKTNWSCPVNAVCPTWKYTDAEGDALTARLNQAENKIKSLQQQLDACMNRPKEKQVVNCEGLATVYYPINQYTLSSREKTILKSVAHVMQDNPNQKYILTGWADNYTGNDEINTRLRNLRVDGVKKYLIKCGVNESQLDARIDANNLTDFGAKGAPLDRAVTIKLAD